jgi:transcriptional regulator with XRE-family HTH domain
MTGQRHLGEFLQARRALIAPQSAGLRAGGRRRVAGLRREEIAQLAGISVEYYQRLEQGRATCPSDQVLDALAEVLRLDAVEREHLRVLARPDRGARRSSVAACDEAEVREGLLRLLERLTVPAMVVTDRFDALALNPIAKRLFPPATGAPMRQWNLARFLFLAPEARSFYVEWDAVAAATAGQLRASAGRYPADPVLARLISELRAASDIFEGLWARAEVEMRSHGTKSFRHPAVGILSFSYETLVLPGDDRRRLVTFTPVPDGPTEAGMQLLAAWA